MRAGSTASAEHVRQVRQRSLGARAPGLDPQLVADVGERERRRPVAGPGRPPGTSRGEVDGRVARPARQRPERAPEVERTGDRVGASEHQRGCCHGSDLVTSGVETTPNGGSVVGSPQTCDASRSSRAWRSSPSSPRSPSRVRSVHGSPALPPPSTPTSSERVEVAALAQGTPMTTSPRIQGPGPPEAWLRVRPSSNRTCEPSLCRLWFDLPSRPPGRGPSAPTRGITTATSRGSARTCTATGPRVARR